ncbi:MAG: ATP-binding protein [Kineosporiaceae bacterium]
MIGAALMRDAAVLGAACHLAAPQGDVPRADSGWSEHPQARADLRRTLVDHAAGDPVARRLQDDLGLPELSYWLVMLCAAVELHPEAAAAVSLLTEDPHQQLPTPVVVAKLARGILDQPFDAALAQAFGGGPAARLGLVEALDPPHGTPRSQQALRLADLGLLRDRAAGAAVLAADLLPVHVPSPGAAPADGEAGRLVDEALALLHRHGAILVQGRSRRGCRQLAVDLAARRGASALLVTARDRVPAPAEVCGRPDVLVALDLHPVEPSPTALAGFVAAGTDLLVLVDDVVDTSDLPVADAAPLDPAAAERIWGQVVAPGPARTLAAAFRVGLDEARAAVAAVNPSGDDPTGDDPTGDDPAVARVARRLRAEGARRMGRHVTVVDTRARLSDLVVPDQLGRQLDEIVSWHRSAHRVRRDMGLPDATAGGLTCLFAGKSGTGKTFAARCLAAELGLNLYRIDLSQVVSKYIGETEKALGQVFDEVGAGHGVLLFDEADALFGRRSEVKDAHDRYANIEVGYLLQRLESHDGVVVLTTNLQGNMDAAFVRRIRFILQFPAPDQGLRRRLWNQALPGPQWRSPDLDLDVLAERFQVSGGAIHSIGLAAAHLAAATPSGSITIGHVVRAAQRELAKSGRRSDASAFGVLGAHLPEAAGARNGRGDGAVARAGAR